MGSKLQEQHRPEYPCLFTEEVQHRQQQSEPPWLPCQLAWMPLRRTTQARAPRAQCPHTLALPLKLPAKMPIRARRDLDTCLLWTQMRPPTNALHTPKQLSLFNLTSVGWIWTTDLEAKGSFMLGLHKAEFLPLHFLILSLSCPDKNRPQHLGKKQQPPENIIKA